MKNTYWDCDYYSIFEKDDEKFIKFWGYFYDCFDGNDAAKPFRCLEFTFAITPLSDYLEDKSIREAIEEFGYRHITDMTEDEAIEAMNKYYNGNPPIPYPLTDVMMETPCGDYVDVRE